MILQAMIESRVLHFVISQDLSFLIWDLFCLHSWKFYSKFMQAFNRDCPLVLREYCDLLKYRVVLVLDESTEVRICDISCCPIIWWKSNALPNENEAFNGHVIFGLVYLKLLLGKLSTEHRFSHCHLNIGLNVAGSIPTLESIFFFIFTRIIIIIIF